MVTGYLDLCRTLISQDCTPSPLVRTVGEPLASISPPENVCRVCGTSVSLGRNYCSQCEASTTHEHIVRIAKIGRVSQSSSRTEGARAQTQRQHALAGSAWHPSSLPTWLTDESLRQKNSATTRRDREPGHYVGAWRRCDVCCCDSARTKPPSNGR
jgi:hypothetical protein